MLFTSTDPAPDHSIIKQKLYLKNWISTGLLLLEASSSSLTKRAGSGAGSVSQSYLYGSPDPDPYQNVTDPEHWPNATLNLAQHAKND